MVITTNGYNEQIWLVTACSLYSRLTVQPIVHLYNEAQKGRFILIDNVCRITTRKYYICNSDSYELNKIPVWPYNGTLKG